MSRLELERVRWGPEPGQPLGGLGSVRIIAKCDSDADRVLERARDVMEIMASVDPERFPSAESWRAMLPSWFVRCFAPAPTAEEREKMMTLPFEKRMKWREHEWYLEGWLYWFQPENRYWYWWDAAVLDENTLVVAIEVREWPFPWGALKWLLEACGAVSVEAEE